MFDKLNMNNDISLMSSNKRFQFNLYDFIYSMVYLIYQTWLSQENNQHF